MIVQVEKDGIKVTTEFMNGEMTRATMTTDSRELTVTLGRVTKMWSIHLDKVFINSDGFTDSIALRVYVNKTQDEMFAYWDKKLKEFKKD